MYGIKRIGGVALGALMMAVVTVAPVYAQSPTAEKASAQAEQIERRAISLMSNTSNGVRAAALFREAGRLRAPTPDASRSMVMAGYMSFYAGHVEQSVVDLTEAAEIALSWGDVVTASDIFLDAAWVAGHGGDRGAVEELRERARKLSRSPMLAEADRASIEARVNG